MAASPPTTPVEVAQPSRRLSPPRNANLESSASFAVEEDILSRIRSLLLSQHSRCPPRTPFSSEEHQPFVSGNCHISEGFDFSTAKSVAAWAYLENGRLSLPGLRRRDSKSSLQKMDAQVLRQPTDSKASINKRTTLRSTSSADDVNPVIGDAEIRPTQFSCCPPGLPEEEKKGFRLPRLVLKDEEDPSITGRLGQSCFDPQQPSLNDALIHETELRCCPPCDPVDAKPSGRYPGSLDQSSVKDYIQLEDLPCPDYKQHHLLESLSDQGTKSKIPQQYEPREGSEELAKDFAKLGLALNDVKVHCPLVMGALDDSMDVHIGQDNLTTHELEECEKLGTSRKGRLSVAREKSPPIQSPTSSFCSLNDLPRATHSTEAEVTARSTRPLSPKITKNLHHRSNKAGKSPANDPVCTKNFDLVFKSRPDTESLLSGASRTSAQRHTLLKSSVSLAQPVDAGLPVPPVLTTVSGVSDRAMSNISDGNTAGTGMVECYGLAKVCNTADGAVLHKATHLAQRIQERVHQERQYIHKGRERQTSDYHRNPCVESDVVLVAPSNPVSRFPGGTKTERPRSITSPLSFPLTKPLDATYWGYVSAVNESIQDALKIAVHKAVHEVALPQGCDREEALDAHRKLVAESLSEAARNADEYLRRASLWERPPQSTNLVLGAVFKAESSCSLDAGPAEHVTTPEEDCTLSDNEAPAGADASLKQADQQHSARTQVPTRNESEHQHSGYLELRATSPNGEARSVLTKFEAHTKYPQNRLVSNAKLGSSPLKSVDEGLAKNCNHDWRVSGGWNRLVQNVSAPAYSAIPIRQSSRNRLLNPKIKTKKSSTRASSKVLGSRKSSLERQFSKGSRGLRSVSSRGMVKSSASAGEEERHGKRPSGTIPSETRQDHNSSATKAYLEENISRKQGANWIREFLSIKETYEPKLTAIPPRTQRDRNGTTRRHIPQAAASKAVGKVLKGSPLTSQDEEPAAPKILTYKQNGQNQAFAPETFTRTINDLENLLNEALFIARQAADPDGAEYVPAVIVDSSEILQGRRKEPGHEILTRPWIKGLHFRAYHKRSKNDISSVESVHESLRSQYGSSMSDCSHRIEFYSNTTPKFSGKRHNGGNIVEGTADVLKSRASSPTCDYRNIVCEEELLSKPDIHHQLRVSSPGIHKPWKEDDAHKIESRIPTKVIPNSREVREYIKTFHSPPIQPRASSFTLRKEAGQAQEQHTTCVASSHGFAWQDIDVDRLTICSHHSLDGAHPQETVIGFNSGSGIRHRAAGDPAGVDLHETIEEIGNTDENSPQSHGSDRKNHDHQAFFSLRGKSHVSLRDHTGFSLARSRRRQPIARDWSPFRKRFVATSACISTSLIGILVGIYAGGVPAIQYYIVDFHHYTILGNVFFFIGLAIPTFFFWPLPLLHGRKPYILSAIAIAMPLLFPQAIAVGQFRSPYLNVWRIGLLIPRALMGFALGFANMNFKSILTDVFGASLQSGNPHQEVVDEFDVRRHGGGMGVWLGIWTWCSIGSLGVGFMAGSVIINDLAPSWGFYISIIITAAVLLLNIITPEVRRSTYRRSVAEIRTKTEVSRRLARGEVMMHRIQTGPRWWGEELHHGVVLSINMLRQPGFLVLALYVAWIYGQIMLIIVLLGALTSRSYRFRSPFVGASVTAVPIGALIAIPFQKASLFSRARHHAQQTNNDTLNKKVSWSSHLVRRAIFTLVLPLAGVAYTLSSSGPPTPFILPILFAAVIGFLSNLAIAECHGIIMETFDTSDLQPGMTGRPRGLSGQNTANKRTNYSSFPRVSSAFAITQGLGYLVAALATGVGGVAQRHLGQQAATGVMAGILLILTVLLLGVLVRFKEVQVIPNSRTSEMQLWTAARRASSLKRAETGEAEEPWRPVIIGNPSGITRRMSVLELGGLSRWSEIRRKNRLIDEMSLEARHPNLATLGSVRKKIMEKNLEVAGHVKRSLSRGSSQKSWRSDGEEGQTYKTEGGDLGGHREMLKSGHESKKRWERRERPRRKD